MVTAPLHDVCPEGLVLDIGGDAFNGRSSELRIGPGQQCTWLHDRDSKRPA